MVFDGIWSILKEFNHIGPRINECIKTLCITLDSVPLGIPAAGHERGFYGLSEIGVLVALNWFYGLPERPNISAVLGERKGLPQLEERDQVWQQRSGVTQHVGKRENWTRTTDEVIHDPTQIMLEEAAQKISNLGNEIKKIAEHSTEEIQGTKQTEAGAIHALSESVVNLIAGGSINELASDRATLAAGEDIEDKADGEIRQSI